MYVRPMQNDDEETFLSLCKDFYSAGATTRGYDEAIAVKTFEYLMHKHENLWGYMLHDADSNEPIGYALITSYWCNEDGGNVVVLDELYVSRSNRNKGYGKLFLDWLEKEFTGKAVSITLEVLTTNTAAKQLYSKMGYSDDGFEILTKHL